MRSDKLEQRAEEIIDSAAELVLPKFVSGNRLDALREREALLIPWLDLYLCFYLPFPEASTQEKNASILVTKPLFERIGLSCEELLARAVQNLSRQTLLMPLWEILASFAPFNWDLAEFAEETDPAFPVWFVSNRDKAFGAAAILCDDVRERLSGLLGSNYLILPSSVHEVLCVSEEDASSAGTFSDMVREINSMCVEPDDQLSDHVYYCRDGVISCAV